MIHRSKEGQREAELLKLREIAHREYLKAGAERKAALHADILAQTQELETLAAKLHQYKCIGCDTKYSAKTAHGIAFLLSWTRFDETGRPVRAETFGPRTMPKIGFCPECADIIEKDIDSE